MTVSLKGELRLKAKKRLKKNRNFRGDGGLSSQNRNATRYLDPKYSRWMSCDPKAAEYMDGKDAKSTSGGIYSLANFNLYHYSNNNPVKYVDPNGKEFHFAAVANEVSQQQKDDFATAINHLKENGGEVANAIISKFEGKNGENITISFVTDGGSTGDGYYTNEDTGGNGKCATWASRSGVKLKDGSVLSPALLLLHELGHAVQDLEGTADFSDPNMGYEQDNVDNNERPVANKLGEALRGDYKTDLFDTKNFANNAVPVDSPTDFINNQKQNE